jgi:TonB family protein
MTAWMLYAIAVALLMGAAAWASEHALALYRRPRRVSWIMALLASVAVPVVAALRPASPAAPASVEVTGGEVWGAPLAAIERVGAATVRVDAVLGGVWVAMSLALLSWLAWSYIRLKREQDGWRREVVDGSEVLVSRDVGPAVADPVAGTIVVPGWLLDLSPDARRLALAHEHAHVAAGDARLVWLGLLLLVAMPWNPVLWWQLYRLRAAIEIDCDQRVLATGAAPRVYAELLLQVSAGRGASLLRPALVEPKSSLGWRISAMIEKRIRARLVRSVVYGSLAAGIVFVACDAPAPQGPEEATLDETPSAGTFDPATYQEEMKKFQEEMTELRVEWLKLYNGAVSEAAVDEVPERISCPPIEYPRLLHQAGIEGRVLTRFVVGTDGNVAPNSVTIIESDHRGFEGPAINMLARCLFRPGRVDGNAVKVAVDMPINFTVQRRRAPVIQHDSSGMRIRDPGIGAQPAYYVDGVRVTGNAVRSLDPTNVERVEVIKGRAAEARYGERARDGVIVITTRKN